MEIIDIILKALGLGFLVLIAHELHEMNWTLKTRK